MWKMLADLTMNGWFARQANAKMLKLGFVPLSEAVTIPETGTVRVTDIPVHGRGNITSIIRRDGVNVYREIYSVGGGNVISVEFTDATGDRWSWYNNSHDQTLWVTRSSEGITGKFSEPSELFKNYRAWKEEFELLKIPEIQIVRLRWSWGMPLFGVNLADWVQVVKIPAR